MALWSAGKVQHQSISHVVCKRHPVDGLSPLDHVRRCISVRGCVLRERPQKRKVTVFLRGLDGGLQRLRGSRKYRRIQALELHRKVNNFLEEWPLVQLRHEHPNAPTRFLISFRSDEEPSLLRGSHCAVCHMGCAATPPGGPQ